jgi:hypothetical protein
LTIDSTGNVGIGTASPENSLTVVCPAGGSETISGNFRSFSLFNANQAGSPGLRLGYNESSKNAIISGVEQGGGNGGGVEFWSFNGSSYGERMRITSDGYLRMASGSGGIQFNGDTAAANALDDYEEGTWTMGVSFGGASVGVTTLNNTGKYTKIGRQVTVTGYLQLSSKGSSTGDAKITGLPFTVFNSAANYSTGATWLGQITYTGIFMTIVEINSTTFSLFEMAESGVRTSITNADFANNSDFIISLTYFTT